MMYFDKFTPQPD